MEIGISILNVISPDSPKKRLIFNKTSLLAGFKGDELKRGVRGIYGRISLLPQSKAEIDIMIVAAKADVKTIDLLEFPLRHHQAFRGHRAAIAHHFGVNHAVDRIGSKVLMP